MHLGAFAGSQPGGARVLVLGARAVSAADVEGNEYTTYVVRCAYVEDGGRVSWEVRRRYQDFFMLHAKLRRYGAVAASLPGRHPFAKLASVVRHREVELHLYLQAILDHCNDKQCSYLAKFLQVQKNLPRYQERVQSAGGAGHRGMGEFGSGEGRGRSPKGAAVGRGRAQSLPRGFGKRTREVVDGVPRSSLHARDDSSAEFSRVFQESGRLMDADEAGTGGDGEPTLSFAQWDEGRRRRQQRVARVLGADEAGLTQNECGVCSGADDGGHTTGAASTAAQGQIGEATARQQQMILQRLRHRRGVGSDSDGQASADPDAAGGGGNELAGIGLFFVQRFAEGTCEVDEVVAGGAAQKSRRIKVGDVLRSVDGRPVAGLDLVDIRHLIIGQAGSPVVLEFSRKISAAARRPLVVGRGESSDEETLSGDEGDILMVRRTPRSRRRGTGEGENDGVGGEERELYFEVQLVRGIALATGDHVLAEEGPSPADGEAQEARFENAYCVTSALRPAPASEMHAPPAAARKLLLQRPDGGEGGDAAGGSARQRPKVRAGAVEEGGGDAGSSSSAQALSYRSTVVANLSGRLSWSGEDEMAGVSDARVRQPASPASPVSPPPVLHAAPVSVSAKGCEGGQGGGHAGKTGVASVEEVCEWLGSIDLSEFASVFRSNKIDGEMLGDLSEADLECDFGMTNKYHRRRLLSKRILWQPGASSAALPAGDTARTGRADVRRGPSASTTPTPHGTHGEAGCS